MNNDRFFARFVTVLDTPGGHMLVCVFIILLGAVLYHLKVPKGEDLMVAGAATLFQAMRGHGSDNKLPTQSSRTVQVVEREAHGAAPEATN